MNNASLPTLLRTGFSGTLHLKLFTSYKKPEGPVMHAFKVLIVLISKLFFADLSSVTLMKATTMTKEDISNASESSLNNDNVVTFSAITNASSYTTDNERWLNEDVTIIVRLTTASSYSPQVKYEDEHIKCSMKC
jgi:hypothetical protein